MSRVHQVIQPGADEVILRLGLELLGMHRRASGQGVRRAIHTLHFAAIGRAIYKVLAAFAAKPAKLGISRMLEILSKLRLSAHFKAD